MGLKILVTGVTGMVGEGVAHVCLTHPEVDSVVVLGRRTSGIRHPKLKEIIHSDFSDFSSLKDQLTGLDGCFFCLGVSSLSVSEEEYVKITHGLTLALAQPLSELNPEMTFCYVSGAGTDSTEKGKVRWARVKGKTENDLMSLPFRQVFAFRPALISPLAGMKNTYKSYKILAPLLPVIRLIYPNGICSLEEIGLAMIHSVTRGYPSRVLEVRDIRALARR